MLAIVSSDKKYISNLLDKFMYKKEKSPNNTSVYVCKYNEHKFIIMVMGYGKVNIGSSLMHIKEKYNVKAVVLVGTAGSIVDNNQILSAIIPLNTLQFDVDFIPNGYMEGQLPGIDKAIYSSDTDLNECIIGCCNNSYINYSNDIIASSDMFVNNYALSNSIRREYDAGAVDTESGAIGEFCYVNDISFSCIKVVSNYANNNAIKQFNMYDEEASLISQKIAYKFIKLFYE